MKGRLDQVIDLLKEVLDSGGELQLAPEGTSMLPLIRPGRDTVILVRPHHPLSAGAIILYQRDSGAWVLHRILAVTKEGYTLCGDNQTAVEPGIRPDQVIRLVRTILRAGIPLEGHKLRWQVYRRVWRHLPLRRLLLGIRRRVHH